MKRGLFIVFVIAVFLMGTFWAFSFVVSQFDSEKKVYFPSQKETFWDVQSVDTMKYSRDLAGEKLKDETFVQEVEKQISAIAKTGATHVAIGTPYDEQFNPFLKLWVEVARKNDLKVWFRGNWSGWEGWFGYDKNMTRQEHIQKMEKFILEKPDLFADGDIFSSCPECENGGPGDPRHNGDLSGHRKFVIDEYSVAKKAFESIGKDVRANYFSMNGDVARLVMDKETTAKLDGVAVIDHYVATPEKLVSDIIEISEQSGGKVVLGEWGVPIPDIHGKMTEDQKAEWMSEALGGMIGLRNNLLGMNYWAAFGGSAALWENGRDDSKTADVLRKYFSPQFVQGQVIDELGEPISGATVSIRGETIFSDNDGYFKFYSVEKLSSLEVSSEGYASKQVDILPDSSSTQISVALEKENRSFFFKIFLKLKKIF